jgi:phage repressor protein C with HTH and peptisase S24 domain
VLPLLSKQQKLKNMSNFIDNIVNQRFRLVYDALKEQGKIKSKSDIAAQLGTYNHVINSILKGKRNITLDQMNKLIEVYGINANFLFGGSQQMFEGEEAIHIPLAEKIFEGQKNISLVNAQAMAGNSLGAQQSDYDDANQTAIEVQRFSIPGLEGDLTAIEISGDSMLPNITNGDIVICEQVESGPFGSIKDNSVYVIVTEDSVVTKRVQNIKQDNQTTGLRLISDNQIYPPYEVDIQEVIALYRVKHRITNYGIA